MALYVNHSALAGNLTAEPEIRFIGLKKTAKAEFDLAINRRFKVDDEWREEVTFQKCEAWGRVAEIMGEWVDKGDNVHIEGALRTESWEDRETGRKNSRNVLRVAKLQFVELRGAKAQARREAAKASGKPTEPPQGVAVDLPDEPPF